MSQLQTADGDYECAMTYSKGWSLYNYQLLIKKGSAFEMLLKNKILLPSILDTVGCSKEFSQVKS